MAQTMIFRGEVDLGAGPTVVVEIWRSGATAVAFRGSEQLAVLGEITVGLTGDGRLVVDGIDPGGQPGQWSGVTAARVTGRWNGATVAWPDGPAWTGAEVTWTQYAVRVSAAGHAPRDLPAARVEVVGSARWIIDGDRRIAASTRRSGCGCGGR